MVTKWEREVMLKETLNNLIGHAIVQAGRAVKVYNLNLFSRNNFEITPEQFIVLSMLDEFASLHQSELCEKLYKDKSNMTRILSILGEKGLIEKVQTVDKKLVNKIKITPKGRAIREKILPVMLDSRGKYLSDISSDDMYVCIKVLTKIQENLAKEELKEDDRK